MVGFKCFSGLQGHMSGPCMAIRLFLCLEYFCYELSILSFVGLGLEGAFLHCFRYKALLQLRSLSLDLCLQPPQQQMSLRFYNVTDI